MNKPRVLLWSISTVFYVLAWFAMNPLSWSMKSIVIVLVVVGGALASVANEG